MPNLKGLFCGQHFNQKQFDCSNDSTNKKITIMEKYLVHSNELHLIDVDKIHQAVERMVDSLDIAAGSTCHFDLYKVVEAYFKDLDKQREINCLLGIVNTEEELEEKMEGF